MMKTKILFISSMILLFAYGCSNNDDLSGDNNTTNNGNISSLADTKWKLASFVDSTGAIKYPEPECSDCYRLYFNTDSTLTGKSSTNYFTGSYKIDSDSAIIIIRNLGGTKINELFDGRLYIENLLAAQSFLVTDNELKLFYNDGKNYLLYEPVDEDDDTEPAVYPVNIEITDIHLDCLKNDTEILYIINSQEELMQRMSCEKMPPPVDFDNYSLLVVSGRATNGIAKLTRQLTQISSNQYVLKIDIKLNDTMEAPVWNVAVLTPKLHQDATIELAVNTVNDQPLLPDQEAIIGKWKLIEENDAWDYNLIRPVDYYRVWEFFSDGTVKYYHNSDNADNRLKTYELKSDSLYIYYDNIQEECCMFIYSYRFIDEEKNKIRIEFLQGNLTDIPQPLLWIYERIKE